MRKFPARFSSRFFPSCAGAISSSAIAASRAASCWRASLRRISFADIIRHIDGPLALAPCASRTAYRPCAECVDVETCTLRPTLLAARDAIAYVLEHTTLAAALKNDQPIKSGQFEIFK